MLTKYLPIKIKMFPCHAIVMPYVFYIDFIFIYILGIY